MNNGENVDQESETIDERKSSEAWFHGLVFLEDEVVKSQVNDGGHDTRKDGGNKP